MPQLAVARRARFSRSLERNPGALPSDPAGRDTLHPLAVLGLAVSLGLATGLVELAVHFIRRKFINPSSMGALQLNPQAYWMVPVSDVLIFGALGLIVAVAAAFWGSRKVSALGVFSLFFLSALAVLLTFRGLTALACSVFSAGLAYRLTTWLLARPERPARFVRRGLPALLSLVVLLACLGPGREKLDEHRLVQAPSGMPNVLFIVLDTVRAQSLSAYGYNRETSPNLTRLAQRGVRFDQARTPAAWTLPSHASMFTGRWPYELSSRPDRPLDDTYPTLAEVLRDRGYTTAGFVGNTYFCNRWFGLDRGFLHYEDVAVCLVEILRSSDMGRVLISRVAPSIFTRDRPYAYFNRKDAKTVNHDMLSWLDSQRKGRPFFAFLNYFDAHDPYISAEGASRHFGLRPETAEEIAALRDWLHVDKSKIPSRLLQMAIDGYDDGIAYLDDQLGKLFVALDSRGLLENTLIVVTADHGELHGEHNNFGHGSHLYRQVVDVPLLIAGPQNVPRGKTVAQPVSLRDVPATVVDVLGFAGPSTFPGRSLSRCWADGAAGTGADEEFLLTETSDELSRTSANETRARALMLAGKVYIRNKDGSEEFYDLETDPGESRDLSKSSDAAGVLGRFRDEMKRIDERAVAVENSRSRRALEHGEAGHDKRHEHVSLEVRSERALAACDFEALD
jgi:arylsulfatase A-like enzyme